MPINNALPTGRPQRWWTEVEVLLLVVLVAGIYFTRLATLPVRGEESRRARVACEMIETGDWIVPREQGRVFADRPPLQNWAIALSVLATGEASRWAIRLHSVLAILLATLLIYAYGRSFLSRAGALVAAAGFATMGQVLELGRSAETEPLFTLLVAGSLIVWIWGYANRWRPVVYWVVGGSLAALAGLTKGPQGPIYFGASTIVFLVVMRDWKNLFSRAHLAGWLAFALLMGAWQLPFSQMVSSELVALTWTDQAAARFDYSHLPAFVKHLLVYPWEVLACMLPWSVLLIGYTNRQLRTSLGTARVPAIFLATSALVCFLPVWIATGARGRYYMPLYPCLALLAAIVAERSLQAAKSNRLSLLWPRWLQGVSLVTVVIGATILIVSAGPWQNARLAQPLAFAALYAAACLVAAVVTWAAGAGRLGGPRTATLAVSCFLGISYAGVVVNALATRGNRVEQAVAELKQTLPEQPRLVSFGLAHHLFCFHYGEPIPVHDWPAAADQLPAELEYFCFDGHRFDGSQLPFAWEPVALVPCDRNARPTPCDRVVVGRVVPGAASRPAAAVSR